MKILKELKGAKNAIVQLVEYQGKEWVYKKETPIATVTEIKFHKVLDSIGLESLEIQSPDEFGSDELLQEYLPGGTLDLSNSELHYEELGRSLRRLHTPTFTKPVSLIENGEQREVNWDDQLKGAIESARKKMAQVSESGLLQNFERYLKDFFQSHIPQFTYVHGDLHTANVLVRGDKVVLFDKSDKMFISSPYFDLATLALSLPNGTLMGIDDPDYEVDKAFWDSFVKGYGTIDIDTLKHYCVLIAGQRVDNRHEPYNLEIIKEIIL